MKNQGFGVRLFLLYHTVPQNGRMRKKQAEANDGLLQITFLEKSVDNAPGLW